MVHSLARFTRPVSAWLPLLGVLVIALLAPLPVSAAVDSLAISVPNGQVYAADGDFITTAFTTDRPMTAQEIRMLCLDDNSGDPGTETFEVAITRDMAGTDVVTTGSVTANFNNTGSCVGHTYMIDVPDVPLAGVRTYYLRTKVIAGAPVRAWSGAMLYGPLMPRTPAAGTWALVGLALAVLLAGGYFAARSRRPQMA